MAQYRLSPTRRIARLAIPENGWARDVAHDEQTGCAVRVTFANADNLSRPTALSVRREPYSCLVLPGAWSGGGCARFWTIALEEFSEICPQARLSSRRVARPVIYMS